MNISKRVQISLLMLLLSAPKISLGDSGGGPKIKNPLKNNDLFQFIDNIIDAALKLGAVVAVLAIIVAGFMFVTAQGDEKKIETAKKILLYAAIGIVILLGARMISTVIVETIKGVDNAS